MRWRGKQRESSSCCLTTHLCRCLMQCFLLGEAEEELGGCSQIASAERQERRREREVGRGRWDGNGEWVYPPRYPVNVCACMPECMSVLVRGGGWEGERDRSGMYVWASLPRQRQWIETEEHSRCVKRRVPPSYITLTQRSAQSEQHLTIWRNNGCKEEQRKRERKKQERRHKQI